MDDPKIMSTQYSDISWLVQDIFPMGLVILAGKPKAGKSCLCVDLAICVASGDKFLGRDTYPSEVFYLSLEEDPRISRKTTQKITSLPDISFSTLNGFAQKLAFNPRRGTARPMYTSYSLV